MSSTQDLEQRDSTTTAFDQPLSVIVPVFNEQTAIGPTLDRLRQVLTAADLRFELIAVDDASTDGTAKVLAGQQEVVVVTHATNRGYGAALKSGMRRAKHDVVVITDADGTYPAEAIPRLLAALLTADMVVGARTGPTVRYSWLRRVPKLFLVGFTQWIVGVPIPDLNSGLRAFRKSDVLRFERLLPDGFSFTTTITVAILTSGLHVSFEPIDYATRIGRSKFRPIRDTWNFGVTLLRLGVYFAPLKVFLPVAAFFALAGMVTLAGDIFIREDITDRTVILLMAAAQVGLLALLADMISRQRGAIGG